MAEAMRHLPPNQKTGPSNGPEFIPDGRIHEFKDDVLGLIDQVASSEGDIRLRFTDGPIDNEGWQPEVYIEKLGDELGKLTIARLLTEPSFSGIDGFYEAITITGQSPTHKDIQYRKDRVDSRLLTEKRQPLIPLGGRSVYEDELTEFETTIAKLLQNEKSIAAMNEEQSSSNRLASLFAHLGALGAKYLHIHPRRNLI